MSSGGVFQLIANDGKADELIMATCLLKARIASMGDSMPTLGDIERTHVLFMHSSFKPFAAFGMEYRKITPTGTVGWGNTLTYSIPQAGDFFSDFGIRFSVAALVAAGSGDTITLATAYTLNGTTLGDLLSGDGPVIAATTTTYADTVAAARWASYPGERAVAKLSFSVNANTLDEYTHKTSAAYRKHYIPASKLGGYKRLVGQEVAQAGVSGASGVGGGASTMVNNTDASVANKQVVGVLSGLQTPKSTHVASTFWHVGRLWFAQQKQQMVPSVSIPYGDRHINVTLAAAADMQAPGDPGMFGRLSTAVAGAYAADELVKIPMTALSGFTAPTGGACSNADMYMNNVYVLPEVHNIFIARVGFSLIRVHRAQTISGIVSGETDNLLSQLKWPVERLVFGVQPAANVLTTAAGGYVGLDRWWQYSTIAENTAVGGNGLVVDTISGAYAFETKTNDITTLSISLHGQKLYDAMPQDFFTDYVPTTYGGSNISASDDDPASGMISFALIGGIYQPNGHLNVSRAREFYFQPTCTAGGTLVLEADAINFLLISDGNAVLRYST
jgi:hypothetical protein